MSTRSYDDVIAAELHRKSLENLTNEMATSLVRTSGSPVVFDGKDFSTCLMDTTPEHLGYSAYVLFHLGSSLLGTQAIIDAIGDDGEVRPGDGWIVNDPYEGGAIHQGDVSVIMPMFFEGEHLGWGFVNMHILDIGGAGMGGIAPGAHDAYTEALRFPPIRAIREGAIDPEWETFIGANVRAPGPVLNDIRSMIAANNVGNRKLGEIVRSFGRERYLEYCEVNKDMSERVLRERISRIPDGTYGASDWVEFDGHGGPDQLLHIGLQLEVSGSDLTFRFVGDPQIDGFVNAGKGAMWGQAVTVILTKLGYGDLPVNGGFWRPITIDVGDPGTIVNPIAPAPVSNGHVEVGMKACKVARDALDQALALSDEPVVRGRIGGKAHDGPPVAGLIGSNQHGSVSVIFYLDNAVGIGGPAQTTGDGQDVYGCTTMTGCGLTDLEDHEAADPLEFLWRRIANNSGGPGQQRGGQGIEQAFAVAYSDQLAGPTFTACTEVPATGFGGGFPGSGSSTYVIRNTNLEELRGQGLRALPERLNGDTERPPNKVDRLVLNRNDVLVIAGGGGSGLGDPLLREADRVAKDVRDGYITAEHAEAAYGVMIGSAGEPDVERTTQRRAEIRRSRIGRAPSTEAVATETPGVSIVRRDGGSVCATCGEGLSEADADWRDGAVLRETEIAERYAELAMFVRPRVEDPSVLMREYYCPGCAGALSVDIATSENGGAV